MSNYNLYENGKLKEEKIPRNRAILFLEDFRKREILNGAKVTVKGIFQPGESEIAVISSNGVNAFAQLVA